MALESLDLDTLRRMSHNGGVAGNVVGRMRAWIKHAKAICAIWKPLSDIMPAFLTNLTEFCTPQQYASSVAHMLEELQPFLRTGDPDCLRSFDVEWSSRAGFPSARGLNKTTAAVMHAGILDDALNGSELAKRTLSVLLSFQRRNLQPLAQGCLKRDPLQTPMIAEGRRKTKLCDSGLCQFCGGSTGGVSELVSESLQENMIKNIFS